MSSVSLFNFSLHAQAVAAPGRVPLPDSGTVKREETLSRSYAAKPAELPSPDPLQHGVTLPSTVDMRFEFNAFTHAWLLAMTDSGSGDVLRKIALKGISGGGTPGLHQAGQWIDKAV